MTLNIRTWVYLYMTLENKTALGISSQPIRCQVFGGLRVAAHWPMFHAEIPASVSSQE